MPDNATVYTTRVALAAHLRELFDDAPDDLVLEGALDREDWDRLVIRWGDVTVRVHHMDHRDAEYREHLSGFQGFVYHHTEEMSAAAWHLLQWIGRCQHTLGCVIEPAYDDDGRAEQIVALLATAAHGLIFIPEGLVLHTDGRVAWAPDPDGIDDEAGLPTYPSALERMERTLATLRERDIRHVDMPPAQADEETVLRDAADVTARAHACYAVGAVASGWDVDEARAFLASRGCDDALSTTERAFFDAPDAEAAAQLSWRLESACLLLWALGLLDLPWPDGESSVPELQAKMTDDDAWAAPSLRPKSEILDALDLTIRLNWAARQANIDETESPVHPGVVYERHYALNWLVGYDGAAWDDVDTPT